MLTITFWKCSISKSNRPRHCSFVTVLNFSISHFRVQTVRQTPSDCCFLSRTHNACGQLWISQQLQFCHTKFCCEHSL